VAACNVITALCPDATHTASIRVAGRPCRLPPLRAAGARRLVRPRRRLVHRVEAAPEVRAGHGRLRGQHSAADEAPIGGVQLQRVARGAGELLLKPASQPHGPRAESQQVHRGKCPSPDLNTEIIWIQWNIHEGRPCRMGRDKSNVDKWKGGFDGM